MCNIIFTAMQTVDNDLLMLCAGSVGCILNACINVNDRGTICAKNTKTMMVVISDLSEIKSFERAKHWVDELRNCEEVCASREYVHPREYVCHRDQRLCVSQRPEIMCVPETRDHVPQRIYVP